MVSTENRTQKNRELITEVACKKLLSIVKNTKIDKFKYLPTHLQFKANSFEYENNKKEISKYQIYKRGAIVLVNFGINTGNELSGNHFAIVLNKSDHPKNSVLTVIPLSSKNKKIYLPLCDNIFELVGDVVFNHTINNIVPEFQKWLDIRTEANKIIKQIEINLEIFKKLEKKYSYNKDKMSEDNEFIRVRDESIVLVDEIKEKENKFEIQRKELIKNIQTISKAAEKYDKNEGKNSYAMIQNIQTISKLKVMKPINEFDPIGKIYISKESMKKIDIEIFKTFTEIPITENLTVDKKQLK